MKAVLEKFALSSWCSFTALGLGLLLFVMYLGIMPVQVEYDVVASVITYCVGALLFFILFLGMYAGFRIRKNGVVRISPSHSNITSGEIVSLCIAFDRLWIPPFFRLKGTLIFESTSDTQVSFEVSDNQSTNGLKVFVPASFPHRGLWNVSSVLWELEDNLGVMKFKTSAPPLAQSITVFPPKGSFEGLPIINSCVREGDTLPNPEYHHGDLFDLKRYHPSDGMRKIVWKVYARTRELLARHPEKTMTPEGKVLVLVWADTEDDSIASLALEYARFICALGLELSLTCKGALDIPPAKNDVQTEKLLIETAWNASTSDVSSVNANISKLLTEGSEASATTHIVVICDLESPVAKELSSIGEEISKRGITPAFIALRNNQLITAPTTRGFPAFLRKVLLESGPEKRPVNSGHTMEFMRSISGRKWELHQVS